MAFADKLESRPLMSKYEGQSGIRTAIDEQTNSRNLLFYQGWETSRRKTTVTELNKLSNREWEVAKLLFQGKSNKLIASSLGISERTVEFHLKNIYAKFQVSSRIELILKLGNATGRFEMEELGHSTVDGIEQNIENRGRLNSWMGRATTFRDPVSLISKELGMKNLLNLNNLLVLIATLLLVFVNWLAFHDFRESHTVRDWLMLIASLLVFLKFIKEFWNRHFGQA